MTFSRPQTQKIFVYPPIHSVWVAGKLLGLWVFVFLYLGRFNGVGITRFNSGRV
jgi:hypothetical protein